MTFRSSAIGLALLLATVGCKSRDDVKWDATDLDDSVEDFVQAFLFLRLEDDPELVQGPHAAGAQLTMNLFSRTDSAPAEWTVRTTNPEIATVTHDFDEDGDLRITLGFLRPGATDLTVTDATGRILDFQPISVRGVTDARIVTWTDLQTEQRRVVEDVHVLPESEFTLAVGWQDVAGTGLTGTGLIQAIADPAPAALTLSTDLELVGRGFEAVDMVFGERTGPQVFTLSLAAGEVDVRDVRVIVHEPSDVDDLVLDITDTELARDDDDEDEDDTDGPDIVRRGFVLPDLLASDKRLLGAPLVFRDDGTRVGTGTFARWEGAEGESSEVSVCYEAVEPALCATATIPGHLTTTGDGLKEGSCGGCRHGGTTGLSWLLLALAIPLSRRRR